MSLRRYLIVVMGGIMAVFFLYTAYWLFAKNRIEAEVQAWIAEQEAAGYSISYESLAIRGFPYRFAVDVEAAQMRAPDSDGGWFARLGGVTASAQPYDFSHWIIGFEGPLFIESGDSAYQLEAERALISLVSDSSGRTRRVGAEIDQMSVESLYGPPAPLRALASLRLSGETMASNEMRMRAELVGLSADPDLMGPELARAFGDTAEVLRADFSVSQWAALAREGDVMAWREAEGKLTLLRSALEWGPALLTAEGDFTVDELARPDGRLSLRVTDPDALAEALIAGGLISQENAPTLRTATLLAPRGPDGVSLPLRLRDGGVYYGPVRLGGLD